MAMPISALLASLDAASCLQGGHEPHSCGSGPGSTEVACPSALGCLFTALGFPIRSTDTVIRCEMP